MKSAASFSGIGRSLQMPIAVSSLLAVGQVAQPLDCAEGRRREIRQCLRAKSRVFGALASRCDLPYA
jgi:hypothetical protein